MFNIVPELTAEPTSINSLYVYLIINTDLNMSVGKIGGQIGHAIQYFMEEILILEMPNANFNSNFWLRYDAWCKKSNIAKITLTANTKEFNKIKEEYNPIVVVDAGHTEIPAGSETLICLYPMFKDERSKTLKRLQILKNSDVIK